MDFRFVPTPTDPKLTVLTLTSCCAVHRLHLTSPFPRSPVSPQRGRGGDERDAAGGDQWRGGAPPLSAELLLEEGRRRRFLQERQELERRRHGDCFT